MKLVSSFIKPRVFRRLEVAYNSSRPHDFFLDKLAYSQWNNNRPFITGPFMIAETANDTYDYWRIAGEIEHSLKYFMKPYKIGIFGNNVKDITQSNLLVRVYLQGEENSNNVLVLMERINLKKDRDAMNYMVAINNRSWQPNNLDIIKNVSKIRQTLVETDKPYPGSWSVNMKLDSFS